MHKTGNFELIIIIAQSHGWCIYYISEIEPRWKQVIYHSTPEWKGGHHFLCSDNRFLNSLDFWSDSALVFRRVNPDINSGLALKASTCNIHKSCWCTLSFKMGVWTFHFGNLCAVDTQPNPLHKGGHSGRKALLLIKAFSTSGSGPVPELVIIIGLCKRRLWRQKCHA